MTIAPIAYRFKLKATPALEEKFYQHAGCRRYVYNWGLNRKSEYYQESKKRLRFESLCKELTVLKKQEDTIWLKDVNAQCLQQSLKDLEDAETAFLKGVRDRPTFQTKHKSTTSFRIPQGVKLVGNLLYLPSIGNVRVYHSGREIGNFKSCTIKCDKTGQWWATLVGVRGCEEPVQINSENQAVGVDFGIKNFAVLSDETVVENLKWLDMSADRIRNLSKSLSRKQKDSRNWNKTRVKLAREYRKVTNKRANFTHHFTSKLVEGYDMICLETLNVAGMAKSKLAKQILDAAWAEALRQIEYKALWKGKHVVTIGRFFPSSRLCTCKVKNKDLKLSDRTWTCKSCGATHDRDLLAALNIKSEGLRIFSSTCTEGIGTR